MITFTPTGSNRVFHDIIQQIKGAILNGELKVGEKLPPERELQSMFQTSRHALREALRVLEEKGLISIKQGSNGGAFVQNTTGEKIGQNLALLIQIGEITFTQLFDFRNSIESIAFEAAVQNAEKSDVQRIRRLFNKLRKFYDEEKPPNEFWKIEQDLHKEILNIVDNPLYKWMVEIILSNSFRYMHVLPKGRDVQKLSVDDWEEILSAFEERNSHRAGTVLRAHLHYYYRAYKKYLTEHNLTDKEFVRLLSAT